MTNIKKRSGTHPRRTPISGFKKYLLVALMGVAAIGIVQLLLTAKTRVELTREIDAIDLPDSFTVVRTEHSHGAYCWISTCPTVGRTYETSQPLNATYAAIEHAAQAAGYELAGSGAGVNGHKQHYSIWTVIRDGSTSFKINITKR